jgi:Kelch motif
MKAAPALIGPSCAAAELKPAVPRKRPFRSEVAWGFALIAILLQVGCGSTSSAQRGPDRRQSAARPRRSNLIATESKLRIQPLSGEALVSDGRRLLSFGGLDRAGASTDAVYLLDPSAASVRRAGSLIEPLHDAAAARVGASTLVFGGGSSATIDAVQRIDARGGARIVGRLPVPASDLSALTVAGQAFVLGGFDGQTTVSSVLETPTGTSLRVIASLQVPVRYTAAASLGGRIYLFGGELADGTDSNLIQVVDPRGGASRVIGHLPRPLAHSSAVTLGGRIYLLGGRDAGAPSSRIMSFDLARGRVETAGKLPQPVMNAAAARVGAAAYLVGGLGADLAPLSTVIQLR